MSWIRSRARHIGQLWKEGLLGKWLAVAWALYGLFVAFRDEIVSPQDIQKWRLVAVVPHLSLAWWSVVALAILAGWVFEASFRLDRKREATIANLSPATALRMIFQPSDKRCLDIIKSRYGGEEIECYAVLLVNHGGLSIENITVRGLPSAWTSIVLAEVSLGHTERKGATVILRTIQELHPEAVDVISLGGVPYNSGSSVPTHILNNPQRFMLEARARNNKTVSLEFEYDPHKRPMLSAVS